MILARASVHADFPSAMKLLRLLCAAQELKSSTAPWGYIQEDEVRSAKARLCQHLSQITSHNIIRTLERIETEPRLACWNAEERPGLKNPAAASSARSTT